MADSRRIDGTVKVEPHPDVADVAYRMARNLWWEEHNKNPKASQGEFLDLVDYCARALKGEGIYAGTFKQRVEAALKRE